MSNDRQANTPPRPFPCHGPSPAATFLPVREEGSGADLISIQRSRTALAAPHIAPDCWMPASFTAHRLSMALDPGLDVDPRICYGRWVRIPATAWIDPAFCGIAPQPDSAPSKDRAPAEPYGAAPFDRPAGLELLGCTPPWLISALLRLRSRNLFCSTTPLRLPAPVAASKQRGFNRSGLWNSRRRGRRQLPTKSSARMGYFPVDLQRTFDIRMKMLLEPWPSWAAIEKHHMRWAAAGQQDWVFASASDHSGRMIPDLQ